MRHFLLIILLSFTLSLSANHNRDKDISNFIQRVSDYIAENDLNGILNLITAIDSAKTNLDHSVTQSISWDINDLLFDSKKDSVSWLKSTYSLDKLCIINHINPNYSNRYITLYKINILSNDSNHSYTIKFSEFENTFFLEEICGLRVIPVKLFLPETKKNNLDSIPYDTLKIFKPSNLINVDYLEKLMVDTPTYFMIYSDNQILMEEGLFIGESWTGVQKFYYSTGQLRKKADYGCHISIYNEDKNDYWYSTTSNDVHWEFFHENGQKTKSIDFIVLDIYERSGRYKVTTLYDENENISHVETIER
jgi:hypothetical protein